MLKKVKKIFRGRIRAGDTLDLYIFFLFLYFLLFLKLSKVQSSVFKYASAYLGFHAGGKNTIEFILECDPVSRNCCGLQKIYSIL